MNSETETSSIDLPETPTTVVVLESPIISKPDVVQLPSSVVPQTISSNYPKISLRMNEFGIYELVPEDPVSKSPVVPETISIKAEVNSGGGERERWKQRFPSVSMCKVDIVCCKQCDGYGMADEFIDKNFCSEKCRKIGQARLSMVKNSSKAAVKRKSVALAESALDSSTPRRERSAISEPAKDNEPKVPKSFSWSKYLEKRKAQGAPERFFSEPYPQTKNGFRPGMKLEAIDPEHQSLFCVMSVAEVQGHRLRLHFDGYSDSHDVWINANSENLFPCGWCEKNGQKLRPPKNYSDSQNPQRSFSWHQYLKSTGGTAAPRNLFNSAQKEFPVPSAFRVKMKLEAVDRRHSAQSLCVATVANVIGPRFLVHFDGWDSIYDYWADMTCPYVHPIGWSREHQMKLTPPCDFELPEGEAFEWDYYLSKTGTTGVPPRAFKPRSPIGFKIGMKLECVDPKNMQLVRVATVVAVKGYRIKVHFDGWPHEYDFWADDDWPDLHPPGWCSKTGHPLQPPPASFSSLKHPPSDQECPTFGCNGIGHIEGAKYATHQSVDKCPYNRIILQSDSPTFPDRLLGEDLDVINSSVEADPVKEEPRKIKSAKVVEICDSLPCSGSPTPMEVSPLLPPPPPPPLQKMVDPDSSARCSSDNEEKPKASSDSETISRIKSDVHTDSKDESSALSDNQDDDPLPPKKKIRKVSYFTGKEAFRDKSAASEETRDQTVKDQASDDHSSTPRSQSRQNGDPAAACPGSVSRSIFEDYSQTNTDLTTPLCWTKHASLLKDMVENQTSSLVAKWTIEQVNEFLAKFGINPLQLEKFKDEQIDGEALLCLSQNDLIDILGVKLGPAIKIRNALLLIKQKANRSAEAVE